MKMNSRLKGNLEKHIPFKLILSQIGRAGINFSRTETASNEKMALNSARKTGYPAYLKVVSTPKTTVHKSKSGLVAKADSENALASAFGKLAMAHQKLLFAKAIDKNLLVAIQKEETGIECIIGARRDSSFGTIIVFGTGGILTEEFRDVSLRLGPVTIEEATGMIKETKIYKRLLQQKNCAKNTEATAIMIARLSNLMEKRKDIGAIDLNPVIVREQGPVAVDVRAVKSKPEYFERTDWRGRAIQNFFNAKSVALIGASRSPESVGQSIMRNLTIGCVHRCEYCRPYLGKIFPVNPHASEVLGIKCYPSILSIPENVDLSIIAIPRDLVLKAVDDCVRKKVKAVIIISAGFGEFDDKGKALQIKIAEKLEKARIPMIGPNCLGIIRTSASLNASFAPSMPPGGSVAFLSQSGALADSIIDWAIQARYGLCTVVSYGNKAMLDCHDFFDFLSTDAETKAIAIYIEGVNNGRRFFEKLKQLTAIKPVVILKGGRTFAGINAAATHTASLAGDAKVFESAVKQAGAFLADTVEELFDIAKALTEQPACKGNGIGIVTNGGGCGVLCSDYCEELGIKLPEISKGVLQEFEKSGIMHPAYSRRNPLDIVGDAMPQRFELAINALLKEPYIHGLIIIQTLQSMTNSVMDAKVIVEAHKKFPEKPIISCFMGGRFSKKGMHYLENMHIPDFNDVRKAAIVMKALIERGRLAEEAAKVERPS